MYKRTVVIVLMTWACFMAFTDGWSLLMDWWEIPLTMSFGSFIAGFSAEGGGAVAFPIFTKVLHIPAHEARQFSLLIQSIGMTMATLFIVSRKVPYHSFAILPAVGGGAIGQKYIFDRAKNPNAHGNRIYGNKVDWKYLDLTLWIEIGAHPKFDHVLIYTQNLYSVQFGRNLKVVVLINTKNGKYVLLASTDLKLTALEIVQFYSLRFQIEFLFRDAKQFTGLNHCQARSEEKLDFHFNMSLAAINLFQLQMKLNGQNNKSMNSFVRKAYNNRIINLLFDELNSKPELMEFLEVKHPAIQKIINLGQVIYKKSA